MATVQADDEEEERSEGTANLWSGIGFAAALAVLAFQLLTANSWISAKDNPKTGDWSLLLE